MQFKVHLCQEQHREKLEGEISCSPAHDFIQLKTKVKRGFLIQHLMYRTVEPRYNEGPRNWQNMFAVTSFRCIKVISIYFAIAGAKNIVH